ncbi:MAG: tetratricopeptide repeat protein [Azospirillaceae bacterium]
MNRKLLLAAAFAAATFSTHGASAQVLLDPADECFWAGERGEYDLQEVFCTQRLASSLPADVTAIAYNNRGNALQNLGLLEDALADYTAALDLQPRYAVALSNRGSAFDQLGQYENAIADYTSAIEFDDTRPEAFFNRANTYFRIGQYQNAVSDYSVVASMLPADGEVYAYRGFANARLGNADAAIEDFEAAAANNYNVTAIQQVLAESGFFTGVITGSLDQATRSAIERWVASGAM